MPLVPVYYGDLTVTNITKTPSFLKVSDYSSVRSLADHMLFLDSHPEEYAKYGQWRKETNPFLPEFLAKVEANLPGPREVKMHMHSSSLFLSNRKAVCCRLCNPAFLEEKMTMHNESNLVPAVLSSEKSLSLLKEKIKMNN